MLGTRTMIIVACIALFASTAVAEVALAAHDDPAIVNGGGICDGEAHGIWSYNDTPQTLGVLGDLDLNIQPGSDGNPNTISTVNADAILCGSDVGGGDFYEEATFTFPNLGEKLRCARSGIYLVSQCDVNGNGIVDANEKVTEGSYAGSAYSATICTGPDCPASNAIDLNPTATYVRFAGSGNAHCTESSSLIACFQAEADLLGVLCDADIVVTRSIRGSAPYKMSIYSPECATDVIDLNPLYQAAIVDLTMCKYFGTVGGTACGASGKWQFKTGSGSGDFTLETGGGGLVASATKTVTW